MDIDNTKRRSYALCPRRFYWEHCRNLRPHFGSTALRYGTTWHAIMEAYYGTIKEKGWSEESSAITTGALAGKAAWEKESEGRKFFDDYRTLENCLSAFIAHVSHYQEDRQFMEILEVEKTFSVPLSNDFNFVGKIDGKVRLNETVWLMEHKTTGMPIDKQLKTLLRDPQVIGYTYAGSRGDNELEGILIPMHHLSASKSRTTGSYGKPRIEFRRSPQIFTEGDITSWLESILWTAGHIAESKEKNFWPMQLDSCYHFGACSYTSLCEQNVPVDETNVTNYIEVTHWNVLEA